MATLQEMWARITRPVAKMWTQTAGAIATLAYGQLVDGHLSPAEVAVFGVQAVGIALVWYADNTPSAPYAKAAAAGYTAGAAALVLALTDGIAGVEWGQVGIAALTAIAVLGADNGKQQLPTHA